MQAGLLDMIQREDPNGNLMDLILELCAPPLVPTPAVLHRCAASSRFLRELVQQVRSRRELTSLAEACTVGGHIPEVATMEGAEHSILFVPVAVVWSYLLGHD